MEKSLKVNVKKTTAFCTGERTAGKTNRGLQEGEENSQHSRNKWMMINQKRGGKQQLFKRNKWMKYLFNNQTFYTYDLV